MYTKHLTEAQKDMLIEMLDSEDEKQLELFNSIIKVQGFSSRLVKKLVDRSKNSFYIDSTGLVKHNDWSTNCYG